MVYSLDRNHKSPLHVLLNGHGSQSQIPISTQIKMISTDTFSLYPLHLALQYGASIEVLNALIAMNPPSLLKRNEQGCTPLHYVFLISDKACQSISMIKSLLTTPGENAARLKDSEDRLPLHIAAERGAEAAILALLIEANTDGCYRQNKDGDLPVHLLIRSGNANSTTVEMLLAPIVDSETICSIQGSKGLELPLHIAAEYNCSYKVIERLLLSYGEAASIPRKRSGAGEPMFAIDIFEMNRKKEFTNEVYQSKYTPGSTNQLGCIERSYSGLTQVTIATAEVVQIDMQKADFDLRSDLIFVFNPVAPTMGSEANPYRKDVYRINRLQSLIQREAISCADYRTVDNETNMSEMSQFAWSFFCTFENPSDPSDEYSDVVRQILRGLPNQAIKILSKVRNPFLPSAGKLQVIDCATSKCKRILSSSLLFAGRFAWAPENAVKHKSEDSLILPAVDYGVEEAYRRFISTFRKEEEVKDIDDVASCHSGIIGQKQSFGDDCKTLFIDFARKLDFDEDEANDEYERLLSASHTEPSNSLRDLNTKDERKEISLEMFRQFCDAHRVDSIGLRKVAIKFMKHRTQFLKEKVSRSRIKITKADCCVFPIIEDYDVDRAEKAEGTQNGSIKSVDVSLESLKTISGDCKDSIFSMDVLENNILGQKFASFRYAIVLPLGDKDLAHVMLHEYRDGVETRNLLLQIGLAVQVLHNGGKLECFFFVY